MPTLTWSTAWKHDEDRYRLEISTDEAFGENLSTYVIETNFYTPGVALLDAVYFWRVKSLKIDGTDSSTHSLVRSFEVDSQPPAEPQPVSRQTRPHRSLRGK